MATKVFQDEKSGVTAMVYDDCASDAYRKIWKVQERHNELNELLIADMPNEIRAVVRVREGDKYDSEVGKRECYAKLDAKHHKAFRNAIGRYIKELIAVAWELDPNVTMKEVEKRNKR